MLIIINFIGLIFCIVLFILSIHDKAPGGAIIAAALFILESSLLGVIIDKTAHPDKFNLTVVETKTPPTIDTLIRYGAVSDTTYIITAIDAKTR